MNIKEINDSVYYVGVNDRITTRFEAMWPLPYGVSYNSYIVKGQKTALIDTVEASQYEELLDHVAAITNGSGIDYLVINHMEPDHSGSIPVLLHRYPQLKLVVNKLSASQCEGFYHVSPDRMMVIKDGDSLDLGGRTLVFRTTPMVHWPETMMTYLKEEEILFSGDAFGCFGALNGKYVDDALTDADMNVYLSEMHRYYANIVGKYGKSVQAAFNKLCCLSVKYICSTHGPVWHSRIPQVMEVYQRLSKWEPQEGAVVVFATMYGNTAELVDRIVDAMAEKGIAPIRVYNAASAEMSDMIADCFRYRTLVIGSPTYSMDIFPPVAALMRALKVREIKNKNVGLFGSFTWAEASLSKLTAEFKELGIEPAATLSMKQAYSPALADDVREFAAALAAGKDFDGHDN